MTSKDKPQPPPWAVHLLSWLHPADSLEEVEGDLAELYAYWYVQSGKKQADMRYTFAVLSVLPPLVRRRQQLTPYCKTYLLNAPMLYNYFTTALRTLSHNKSYTAINLAGLTLSLTCCLLLCLVITHELSYDTHHQHAERIYRVETLKIEADSKDSYSGAPLGIANALRTNFPEIEKVSTINLHDSHLLSFQDQTGKKVKYKESLTFVDVNLFDLFDYEWIAGNPRQALLNPNSVVLTEKYAQKYFGTITVDQILGQVLTLDGRVNLKVTGIVKNPPSTTNFPFHILVSFATQKSLDNNFNPDEWGRWSDNAQTYVLLSPQASKQGVESRFPQMWDKYHGGGISTRRGSHLVPLTEIHFHGNYSGRTADWKSIYIMGIIGVLLLLTACANFINLATAQAFKRSKEVGVRKILGSSRKQLIFQFMAETGLLTMLAIVLTIVVSLLLLPSISSLLGVPLSPLFILHPAVCLFLIAVLFTVTILAGFYPAFVLSSFAPIKAIKNKITQRRAGSSSFAKNMIVLQFTISQVLIIGTLIVNGQMELFKDADLGFDKESLITVPVPTQDMTKLRYLRTQLLRLSDISHVSFSFNSASSESNMMGELAYQKANGEEVKIRTQFKLADAHFIPTYGIRLLAGKNLPDVDSTSQIIINEVFMKRMGIEHAQAALGEIINNGGQQLQIVGVAADFHVNSLHQKIDPTIIGINPQLFYQAGIKLGSSEASLKKALTHIEQVWTTAFPDEIYSYQFLDETLQQAYGAEERTFYLMNIFSSIAIFVSCLGIYGLISFITAQRTKEIGVRKVLGASTAALVSLLSKDFMWLVLIAFVLASPLAWYSMNRWLEEFAYRVHIGVDIFLLSGATAMLIAFLTISYKAIRAALANPVKILRNE